jgi:hypothetical protein
MTEASDKPGNPSRRNFVLSCAAVPLGAVVAVPSINGADPIFAAIDTHKRAWAALDRDCSALTDAEADGDQQAQQTLDRLHDAIDDAETELLNVIPTTIAGASALLMYAADHVSAGNFWPTGYVDEQPRSGLSRESGVSWEVILHRNLAKALPNITA